MKPPIAPSRSRSLASVTTWTLAALCLLAVALAAFGRCVAPGTPCLWLHVAVVSGAALLGLRAGVLAIPTGLTSGRSLRRPSAPASVSAASSPLTATLDLADVDAQVRFHDDPAAVPAHDWRAVVDPDEPFMDLAYLRGLREGEHGPIQARYALLYRDGRPIAAAYYQIVAIDPRALGQDAAGWRREVRLLIGLWQRTQLGPLRILVCGNALHSRTGAFQAPGLPARAAADALDAMTEALRREESRCGRGAITLTMLKDLEGEGAEDHAHLVGRGYHLLPSAQPTMTLPIAATWRRFDDYLAAMSSKYRKRAKAARKRGVGLRRVDLSAAAIEARAGELQALLDAVMQRADFKLTSVSIAALATLKGHLGDRLAFTAYEHEGALVGFAAALVGGGRHEALFVGLDYAVNQDLALYQNILYDFVDAAIRGRARALHLGRSALEIKSTVGAAPVPLRIYLRHPSRLMNRAVARALATTSPAPWVQRRPFKGDEAEVDEPAGA
ncbi:MAG: GNAT family N-acetyltransferase [Nannocystaceae bacterium]